MDLEAPELENVWSGYNWETGSGRAYFYYSCCFGSQSHANRFKKGSTGPFTILEPSDQEIGELYVVQERRMADFEAPNLRKTQSGSLRSRCRQWTAAPDRTFHNFRRLEK